jgi:hypothetical protein
VAVILTRAVVAVLAFLSVIPFGNLLLVSPFQLHSVGSSCTRSHDQQSRHPERSERTPVFAFAFAFAVAFAFAFAFTVALAFLAVIPQGYASSFAVAFASEIGPGFSPDNKPATTAGL